MHISMRLILSLILLFGIGTIDANENIDESLSSIVLFESLTKHRPDQEQYFYQLGKSYYNIGDLDAAIAALEHALALQPNDPDARVILAYAYLSRYRSQTFLKKSEQLFHQVLKSVPNYTDAKEGLKRIASLQHASRKDEKFHGSLDEVALFEHLAKIHPDEAVFFYALGVAYADFGDYQEAIDAFNRALKLQPGNPDVKLSLGYALLNQYTFQDDLFISRSLFQQTLDQFPNYTDAQEGLRETDILIPYSEKKKKTLTPEQKWIKCQLKIAKALSNEGDHWGAIEIYQSLTEVCPNNAEYFYLLGREYVRANCHNEALCAFIRALELKPDHADALVALGNQYLYFEDYESSLDLFLRAIEIAPKDTDALVGAARAEALLERPWYAEEYFDEALELQPENPDIVLPYASFLLAQRRYTEGEAAYRYLAYLQNDNQTYRWTLFDTSSYTTPGFYALGGTAEEREKDQFTHKWVASLRYINAEGGLFFPINDCYRVSIRGRWLDVRQRNLVAKLIVFESKFIGGGIRGEWFYDPFWTITVNANVTSISNTNTHALLHTKACLKLEPSCVFRYAKALDTILFGVITDSWIFKNFNKGIVSGFTRESLFMIYQHDFGNQRMAGADAAWLWYQDPISNQEQDLNLWAQAGIPCTKDTLSLRYHCEYRQFKEETQGYYSFEYQLTHWLKMRWYKTWLFGGRCELLYWHGWRTTRGRNPQQQITGPIPAILPVTTVGDQINAIYLTFGYTPTTNFDISFSGNYWHDSFDYTVVGCKLLLDWKF